jgi:ankyrin repeat protein
VKLLLGDNEHLLDPTTTGKPFYDPLIEACTVGDLEMVKFLVEITKRKAGNHPWGYEGFFKACQTGNLPIAKFLYEAGADREGRRGYLGLEGPEFKLIHAICESLSIEIVDFLVQNGFDLISENGDAIMNGAVERGRLDMIRYLIKQGVPVDSHVKGIRCTPLLIATKAKQREVVKLLLENGADPTAKFRNIGILHEACITGDPEIVSLIMEHGADLSSLDGDEMTCFHTVARFSNVEVLRVLMKKSSRQALYRKDSDGNTPLHLAVKRAGNSPGFKGLGSPEEFNHDAFNLVEYMVKEQGEDPNQWNWKHQTAWHLALGLSSVVLGKFTDVFFSAGFMPPFNTRLIKWHYSQYYAFGSHIFPFLGDVFFL